MCSRSVASDAEARSRAAASSCAADSCASACAAVVCVAALRAACISCTQPEYYRGKIHKISYSFKGSNIVSSGLS